jgi:hypothetical protein
LYLTSGCKKKKVSQEEDEILSKHAFDMVQEFVERVGVEEDWNPEDSVFGPQGLDETSKEPRALYVHPPDESFCDQAFGTVLSVKSHVSLSLHFPPGSVIHSRQHNRNYFLYKMSK